MQGNQGKKGDRISYSNSARRNFSLHHRRRHVPAPWPREIVQAARAGQTSRKGKSLLPSRGKRNPPLSLPMEPGYVPVREKGIRRITDADRCPNGINTTREISFLQKGGGGHRYILAALGEGKLWCRSRKGVCLIDGHQFKSAGKKGETGLVYWDEEGAIAAFIGRACPKGPGVGLRAGDVEKAPRLVFEEERRSMLWKA